MAPKMELIVKREAEKPRVTTDGYFKDIAKTNKENVSDF